MNLKELAKSGAVKQIIELLKDTEDQLADIRFRPNMSIETRKEVITIFHEEVVLRVQRAFGISTKKNEEDDRKGMDGYN